MPLITKVLPATEDREVVHDSVQVQHSTTGKEEKEDKDSGYEDFGELDGEEEFQDSDMEGSILNRPRPKKPARAPALPQRSDRRTSKILDSVMLELKSLDGSATKDMEQQSIVSDPHEMYLSSEEDASLSDDYEDYESLIEFDITDIDEPERATSSSSRTSSRKSQEDTARVVSFTLCKPQLIDIYIHPNTSQTRISTATDVEVLSQTATTQSKQPKPTPRRPPPLKFYPSSTRRMSVSSITSVSTYSSAAPTFSSRDGLPPRKSSKLSVNLSSLVTSTKSSLHSLKQTQSNTSHSFLNSDPFPAQEATEYTGEEEPVTPKTPTSIAASAWRRGLNRTLNKARKPSMPNLKNISLSYTPGVVVPRNSNSSKLNLDVENSSLADLISGNNEEKERNREDEEGSMVKRSLTMPMQATPTILSVPVTYEDILENVIRLPPPPPLGSPKERWSGGLKMGLIGLGRRESMKRK